MNKYFLIPLVAIMISLLSCAESEISDFQKNSNNTPDDLFEFLEDFPIIDTAFNSLDEDELIKMMEHSMSSDVASARDAMSRLQYVLDPEEDYFSSQLSNFRSILDRIIDQDNRDVDPKVGSQYPVYDDSDSTYIDGLYGFLDLANQSDAGFANDLVAIPGKITAYLRDTFPEGNIANEGTMEHVVADLVAHLEEDTGQSYKSLMGHMKENVSSKLLFQNNEDLWLEEEPTVDIDPAITVTPDETGGYNLKVGNPTRGIDALLSGLNEVLQNETARDGFFGIFRGIGNAFAPLDEVENRDAKAVLKDTFINLEDYFTESNDQNEDDEFVDTTFSTVNTDYSSKIYSTNSSQIYSNSELRATLREFMSGLMQMTLRSDRYGSILNDYDNGTPREEYFLEKLAKNIASLGVDPDNMRFEESVYDLIRYDQLGRDRINDSSADEVSYLENMLFLGVVSSNSGWEPGGNNAEAGSDDEHGHGPFTGILTLADSLFSIKLNRIQIDIPFTSNDVDATLYDKGFNGDDEHARRISRSRVPFKLSDKDHYQYRYDEASNVLDVFQGNSVGDSGSPTGGNPNWDMDDTGDGDVLNGYHTFSPDGYRARSPSLASGHLVRACFNGEGPYYYDPALAGEAVDRISNPDGPGYIFTYYRPNGKIYVKITKENPTIANWTYKYPVDEGDPVDPVIRFEAGDKDHNDVELTCDTIYYYDDSEVARRKLEKVDIDDPGTWILTIDPADAPIFDDYKQRWNRYKYRWDTDFYILESHRDDDDNIPKYWTINNDGNGNGLDPESNESSTGLTELTSPNHVSAAMTITEAIQENTADRACASQEEAFYRNFQWVATEKKMVNCMPVLIRGTAGLGLVEIISQVIMINQANGLAGQASQRQFYAKDTVYGSPPEDSAWYSWRMNRWAKDGGTGNSSEPGDYRADIRVASNISLLTLDLIASGTNNGSTNPGIISQNLKCLYRLAFPRSGLKNRGSIDFNGDGSKDFNITDYQLGSRDFTIYDSTWSKRNAVAIFMIAMSAAQREFSRIEDSNSDGLKNDADRRYDIIQHSNESLISLIKPMFFYYRGNGTSSSVNPFSSDYPATDPTFPVNIYTSDAARQTWLPRINGKTLNVWDCLKSDFDVTEEDVANGTEGFDNASWYGGEDVRDFFRPKPVHTLLSTLIDSDSSLNRNDSTQRCDGILPMLVEYDTESGEPKTRLFTGLLKLLITMSDSSYDDTGTPDENDYRTWGARRKLLYGLEQIQSSIRFDAKGEMDIINSTFDPGDTTDTNCEAKTKSSYGLVKKPDWIFSLRTRVDPDDVADIDAGLNLDEFIGSDSLDKGLAVFVDNRGNADDARWTNFGYLVDALAGLLSSKGNSGGKYNFMENLIGVADKAIVQLNINDDHLRALRHTAGVIGTHYYDEGGGDMWLYPDEMLNTMTVNIPRLYHDIFNGYIHGSLTYYSYMFEDEGMAEYVLSNLKFDSPMSDVVSQIFDLMGDDRLTGVDPEFWNDVIDLATGVADSMKTDEEWSFKDFQKNR